MILWFVDNFITIYSRELLEPTDKYTVTYLYQSWRKYLFKIKVIADIH